MMDKGKDVPSGIRSTTRKNRSYSFWERKRYSIVYFVRVYESCSGRKGRIIS